MKLSVECIIEKWMGSSYRNSDGTSWEYHMKTSYKVYLESRMISYQEAVVISDFITQNALETSFDYDTPHVDDERISSYDSLKTNDLIEKLNNLGFSNFEQSSNYHNYIDAQYIIRSIIDDHSNFLKHYVTSEKYEILKFNNHRIELEKKYLKKVIDIHNRSELPISIFAPETIKTEKRLAIFLADNPTADSKTSLQPMVNVQNPDNPLFRNDIDYYFRNNTNNWVAYPLDIAIYLEDLKKTYEFTHGKYYKCKNWTELLRLALKNKDLIDWENDKTFLTFFDKLYEDNYEYLILTLVQYDGVDGMRYIHHKYKMNETFNAIILCLSIEYNAIEVFKYILGFVDLEKNIDCYGISIVDFMKESKQYNQDLDHIFTNLFFDVMNSDSEFPPYFKFVSPELTDYSEFNLVISPLCIACGCSRIEMVKILLSMDIDINASICNYDGHHIPYLEYTALDIIIKNLYKWDYRKESETWRNYRDIYRMLLNRNAITKHYKDKELERRMIYLKKYL